MGQDLQGFDAQITKSVRCEYWHYLPPEYGRDDRRWPLLLFLHGKGERGHAESVLRHGPPKLIAAGRAFPFIVVSPICPAEHWWDAETLGALLDRVCADHAVDEDRIYVTGLSMGGFGTWTLAMTYPDRFAAIAPVCGGGSPYLAERIAHLPVWVFHGAKDPVVPLYESERMVEALQKIGGKVKFTVYSEAGHDCWTETYANDQLYDWLLSYQRP